MVLNEDTIFQYQHGNVKVGKNDLSISLVFRNCTRTLHYDHITHKRVLDHEYIQKNQKHFHTLDLTYLRYREHLSFIGTNFTDSARDKLKEWRY